MKNRMSWSATSAVLPEALGYDILWMLVDWRDLSITLVAMGIYDRDYMKDSKGKSNASGREDVIALSVVVTMLAKLLVVFVAVFFCLRFLPSIWIKLAASVAVFYFGWRWIAWAKNTKSSASANVISSRRVTGSEGVQKQLSEIKRYEAAVDRSAKLDRNAVRLLVAYDAAGEFGKAKTLIQRLDGEEFPESVAEELETLAKNYFPVKLKTTETGVRFELA